MSGTIFLVLRRLRQPLMMLISAYTVAIVGFTLMPGTDDQGNPWSMSFFEAFYVVTYTAPTIGFGELPYTFSGAQRLWTSFTIYITVLAWLYSVGTIISLMQDPAFRRAVSHGQVSRSVRRMADPFWLVCGFGDSGRLMVRALAERGRRVVVIDDVAERVEEITLREYGIPVPAFHADARVPDCLLEAGLTHRWCMGAIAVTDDDHVNLKIAITSKLLNPTLPVFCRAEHGEPANNMASFGTDVVIDPYTAFADRLALAIRAPDKHQVYDWLSGIPHTRLSDHPTPPAGRWIICGYGRLGQAVHKALSGAGIETTIIDPSPDENICPPGSVKGKGTEAVTLRAADLEQADALLAGTADDADNLSIIMTARDLKPDIFVVARENSLHNKALFEAAEPDLLVKPSYIIVSKALSVLNAPLLGEFLDAARDESNDWNAALASQLRAISGGVTPECWTLRVSQARSPAIVEALDDGAWPVRLDCLLRDPRQRDRDMDVIALMLQRGRERWLLPDRDSAIQSGDRLVFCGTEKALSLMRGTVRNPHMLRYVATGDVRPEGWLWRRLLPFRSERAAAPRQPPSSGRKPGP